MLSCKMPRDPRTRGHAPTSGPLSSRVRLDHLASVAAQLRCWAGAGQLALPIVVGCCCSSLVVALRHALAELVAIPMLVEVVGFGSYAILLAAGFKRCAAAVVCTGMLVDNGLHLWAATTGTAQELRAWRSIMQ